MLTEVLEGRPTLAVPHGTDRGPISVCFPPHATKVEHLPLDPTGEKEIDRVSVPRIHKSRSGMDTGRYSPGTPYGIVPMVRERSLARRFNPNKLLQDPLRPCMGELQEILALFGYQMSPAMIEHLDERDSAPFVPKCSCRSKPDWSGPRIGEQFRGMPPAL